MWRIEDWTALGTGSTVAGGGKTKRRTARPLMNQTRIRQRGQKGGHIFCHNIFARGACTYDVHNDRCDLFSLWTGGSWVLGTNVGNKLFVTLSLVLLLHFIQ